MTRARAVLSCLLVVGMACSSGDGKQALSLGEPFDRLGINEREPNSHWDYWVTDSEDVRVGLLRFDRAGSDLAPEFESEQDLVDLVEDNDVGPAGCDAELREERDRVIALCLVAQRGVAATFVAGSGVFRFVIEKPLAEDVIVGLLASDDIIDALPDE